MNKKLLAIPFLGLAMCSSLSALTVIDNPTSKTININVSNKSINRLVLPSKIIDVAYSKEKGVSIQINDNQAFIKFVPTKKEKIRTVGNRTEVVGEPEIIYENAKDSEVFFVTTSGTYAFALNPKSIEAETVIVNDFTKDKKEVLEYERADDYIATLSKITENILKGNTPSGYKIKKKEKVLSDLSTLRTTYIASYNGVLYSAHLIEVENKTKEAIILNPKEFISQAVNSPKSISIYYGNEVNHLLPLGTAKVVIITKAIK